MKQTIRPGAFARLDRAARRHMRRRSQFIYLLLGASISRTLAYEFLAGALLFTAAFFADTLLNAAAFVLSGVLVARRPFAAIDAQIDNDGHGIDHADTNSKEKGGER